MEAAASREPEVGAPHGEGSQTGDSGGTTGLGEERSQKDKRMDEYVSLGAK